MDSTTWSAPLLPVGDNTYIVNGWSGQCAPLDSVARSTDSLRGVVDYASQLSGIKEQIAYISSNGVGYHNSVGTIAIPLIIAIFAFGFTYIFSVINHINEKYGSPEMTRMFEETSAFRCFWLSTKISIGYLAVYGLLTIFVPDDSWAKMSIFADLSALAVSIGYASVIIWFALTCMRFNKPEDVLKMLKDNAVRVPKQSLITRIRIYCKNIGNQKNEELKEIQNFAESFYQNGVENWKKEEYIKRLESLAKFVISQDNTNTLSEILGVVDNFVMKEENSKDIERWGNKVLKENLPHRYSDIFYDRILREEFVHNVDRNKIEDLLVRHFLQRYPKSKLITHTDIVTMTRLVSVLSSNNASSVLEKYIEHTRYGLSFILSLRRVAYVTGIEAAGLDEATSEANDNWEEICNYHFLAFAVVFSDGLYNLLPRLLQKNSRPPHHLYPFTRADILYKYSECLKHTKDDGYFYDDRIEDILDRQVDIKSTLSQYAAMLLFLADEKSYGICFSKDDLLSFGKAIKDIEQGALRLKTDSKLNTLYPDLKSYEPSKLVAETIKSIQAIKTSNSYKDLGKEKKNDCGLIRDLFDKVTLPSWLECFVLELACVHNGERNSRNNYKEPLDEASFRKTLWGYFSSLTDDINNSFDEILIRNENAQNPDSIAINDLSMYINKLFYLSVNGNKSYYYLSRELMDIIKNRTAYAILTALDEMEVLPETVSVANFASAINDATSGKIEDYVVLSVGKQMQAPLPSKKVNGAVQTILEVEIDSNDYSFLRDTPLYEKYKGKFILIQKCDIPAMDMPEMDVDNFLEMNDESDEDKGIMDVKITITHGLSLKYNKKAEIRIYTVTPVSVVVKSK